MAPVPFIRKLVRHVRTHPSWDPPTLTLKDLQADRHFMQEDPTRHVRQAHGGFNVLRTGRRAGVCTHQRWDCKQITASLSSIGAECNCTNAVCLWFASRTADKSSTNIWAKTFPEGPVGRSLRGPGQVPGASWSSLQRPGGVQSAKDASKMSPVTPVGGNLGPTQAILRPT